MLEQGVGVDVALVGIAAIVLLTESEKRPRFALGLLQLQYLGGEVRAGGGRCS